jgi:hypothetical protein
MAQESFKSVVTAPKTVFTPYLPKSATEKALSLPLVTQLPSGRRGGGGFDAGPPKTLTNAAPSVANTKAAEETKAQQEAIKQKINEAIKTGAIQGYSGKFLTNMEFAKAQLLTKLEESQKKQSIRPPEQYGEYIKGYDPQGKELLQEYNKTLSLKEKLPEAYNIPKEIEIKLAQKELWRKENLYSGQTGPALLTAEEFKKIIEIPAMLSQKAINKLIPEQASIKNQVQRGALFLGSALITPVGISYGASLGTSLIEHPIITGIGIYEYAKSRPIELGTSILAYPLIKSIKFKKMIDVPEIKNINIDYGMLGKSPEIKIPKSKNPELFKEYMQKQAKPDLMLKAFVKEIKEPYNSFDRLQRDLKLQVEESTPLKELRKKTEGPAKESLLRAIVKETKEPYNSFDRLQRDLRLQTKESTPLKELRKKTEGPIKEPLLRAITKETKENYNSLNRLLRDLTQNDKYASKELQQLKNRFEGIKQPEPLLRAIAKETKKTNKVLLDSLDKNIRKINKEMLGREPEALLRAFTKSKPPKRDVTIDRLNKLIDENIKNLEKKIKAPRKARKQPLSWDIDVNFIIDKLQSKINTAMSENRIILDIEKRQLKLIPKQKKITEAKDIWKEEPTKSDMTIASRQQLILEKPQLKEQKVIQIRQRPEMIEESIYAGKGLYERTGMQFREVELNIQRMIKASLPLARLQFKQENLTPPLRQKSPYMQNPETAFKFINKQIDNQLSKQQDAQDFKHAQNQIFKQAQASMTQMAQAMGMKEAQAQKSQFKLKKETIKEGPRMLSPPKIKPQSQKQKSFLGPGYIVYGKVVKSSRFVKINSYPLTKARALDVGTYYVDNTLARQFKIRQEGQAQDDYEFAYIPYGYHKQRGNILREYKIKNKNPYAFGEQFIEKAVFMQDTAQEKRQLKEFQRQVGQILR